MMMNDMQPVMNEEHTENVYWKEQAFMIGVFSWVQGGGGY